MALKHCHECVLSRQNRVQKCRHSSASRVDSRTVWAHVCQCAWRSRDAIGPRLGGNISSDGGAVYYMVYVCYLGLDRH